MKTTVASVSASTWRSSMQSASGVVRRLMLAIAVLCAAGVPVTGAGAVCGPTAAERELFLALFLGASNPERVGFARVINHSNRPGTVRIVGIDDAGMEYGPIDLSVDARASVQFNSHDLETGNPSKGLSGKLGDREGDWRLHLDSDLDIELLSYVRTGDGFVTAMHQVVPAAAMRHHVSIFNPGSNHAQRSRLRLINPTGESVAVIIEGRDDAGEPAPGGEVRLTLAPGEARAVGAQELESGGASFTGRLGDGSQKWQLFVSASGAIHVMSLLESPTGHLSNLSARGITNAVALGAPTTVPEPRLGQLIEWRENISAEDILDDWNHPAALREAIGLQEAVDPCDTDTVARREAFGRLSEALEGGPGGSGTLLRNIRPEAIEVIGERDGMIYGQWKGGPAGTLNIEFDWRFAQEIQNDVRAQFERAAKVWARRIEDDFRTYTIPEGRTFSFPERFVGGPGRGTITFTFDEDVTTDGLLIPVIVTDKAPWASAGFDVRNLDSDVENTHDDFQPSLAIMFVNPNNPNLRERWADTVAHEVGHALGIADVRDGSGNIRNLSWLRNLNRADHTFVGTEAQRANGGDPVLLQWLDPQRGPVAPHTPGAERDTGHLGVCNSIVSYVCNLVKVLIPTELDFAVLDDIGYEILDRETASEPELYGYVTWGRYSAWGAGVERNLQYNERTDLIYNPT